MSAAIVGGEPSLVRALADQLRGRGLPVVAISDGAAAAGPGQLSCDTSSAEQVEACLCQAEATLPDPPALIRIGFRSAQASATEVAALSLDEWTARTEAPLGEALAFHQAAQRFLADRAAGRIIVVIPTVGLSGGAGFVPLATTAEADRTLVKAQARVSGAGGVTINCIAVASALLAAGTGDDPDRRGLPAPALPEPGLAQVAAAIIGLLGPDFDAVTGQTIAVDGGRWMAP